VELLALLLIGLAAVGLALLTLHNGGLAGVYAKYASHDKLAYLDTRDSLANALWNTFSVWGVWVAILVCADRGASAWSRLGFGTAALGLGLIQVMVFASRLYPVLMLLGGWICWHQLGRRIPLVALGVVAVVGIVGSVGLIQSRTHGLSGHGTTGTDLVRVAGYSVLDTTIAIRQRPADLRELVRQPDQWIQGPLYLLPHALRPGVAPLDSRRFDVYTASALGTGIQRLTTGLPAGFAAELWLLGGWGLVIVVVGALGLVCGLAQRGLRRLSSGRPAAGALIGSAAITALFTFFKDGDLLVSMVNGVKTTAYLAILVALVGLLRTRRETVL
jgi:hypothetical protein